MTTAPTELKPCPFCAGPARSPVYYNGTMETGCGSVECPGSDVLVPIAAWNTRAPAALEPQAVDDAMVERGELSVADALVALTAAIAREDRESQIKYQALATIAVNIEKSEPTAEFAVALKNWWEEEKAKIYPSRAALQAAKEPSHD